MDQVKELWAFSIMSEDSCGRRRTRQATCNHSFNPDRRIVTCSGCWDILMSSEKCQGERLTVQGLADSAVEDRRVEIGVKHCRCQPPESV